MRTAQRLLVLLKKKGGINSSNMGIVSNKDWMTNKQRNITKRIMILALAIAIVAGGALMGIKKVLYIGYITSCSMENTIMTGDKIIANRISYTFSKPKRGDIVVFKIEGVEGHNGEYCIKRVAAVPGDRIEVVNGQVYLNESVEPLDEPYASIDDYGTFGEYFVPDNCYFVLGDNRAKSQDSRFWIDIFVKESDIVGKVVYSFTPSRK